MPSIFFKLKFLPAINIFVKFSNSAHQCANFQLLSKIILIWPNFRFLSKFSIFNQNFDQKFDFRPKFQFPTKITISDQNFDFWHKNHDFRRKFKFSIKISIFDQSLDFRKKFDFRPKFQFSTTFLFETYCTNRNFQNQMSIWHLITSSVNPILSYNGTISYYGNLFKTENCLKQKKSASKRLAII